MYGPVNGAAATHQAAPEPSQVQPLGQIKLNFGAAVAQATNEGGVGVVARDYNGLVLAWSRKRLQGNVGVDCSEAFVARFAINLIKAWDLTRSFLKVIL